ncbi:hypothetical protein TBLA_0A09240 [Henningerozyma blattae CBS 6284]|uniref:Elongation factor 1 alpha-like protein n=1 Tax=Henningerozyma blattae (strain ATCC 34711 / CBS 6284 / DSM 70876 / NBRC 10599 / NRRL Y-10934 / UCD 77-7) TaxID=1071380 RepID=I2GX60_HENB6|nr:hypothetical protein TBLA_0A09240 [Tetrapisispora blattae CBS 6284]CCH58712.1 hypothetical protein TBLA_0A09240 [Tetrapisispora blattae CBS 6284]
MAPYDYDDDDLEDFHDDIPDFQDEQEFDDYLNDEEYDLMSQQFPQAKKALQDYQGWNNLAVKLAIFDSDFDLDQALINLKRTYKKKKTPAPKPIIATPQAVNSLSADTKKLSITGNDEVWFEDEDDKIDKKDEPVLKTYKRTTVPTKPRNMIDIKKYIENTKPHCSFVVLGHVDAGKSTLMGRLLYDIGAVDNQLIRKLKKESESIGKGSFHLAWVMDQTKEERERGVTVSICTSDFETDKVKFTIVDAPGHRDFVPNAIQGISQADVGVLSIDCGTDAFESGFNLDGQTKEHALLARSMGVHYLIIVMNKMDSVNWSEERFQKVKADLSVFFDEIGFKENQIEWVPVSGLSGAGVYKIPYPEAQNWYQGPNLVQRLEELAEKVYKVSSSEVLDTPFLFAITDVTTSKKAGEAIITGRVEAGSIQPGETITIYPSEQSVLVDKITSGNEDKTVPIAIKNDFVTLKLRHAFPEDIQAGDLGAYVTIEIPPSQNLKLHMLTFKLGRPILPGTPVMLFKGVREQPARINKLVSLVDKHDVEKIIKKKVRHLSSGQAAIVEVELVEKKRWIPILTFQQNKHLGRVILRKDGKTIAAGIILDSSI